MTDLVSRRLVIASAILGVSLASGCASLHMRDSDSVATKLLKGVARVPVGVLSLGFSEIWHANEREMEVWLGKDRASLIMAWGMPTRETDDGEGGSILIYESDEAITTGGHATTTFIGTSAYTSYTPPQTHHYKKRRTFRLDKNGIVISYAWKGL